MNVSFGWFSHHVLMQLFSKMQHHMIWCRIHHHQTREWLNQIFTWKNTSLTIILFRFDLAYTWNILRYLHHRVVITYKWRLLDIISEHILIAKQWQCQETLHKPVWEVQIVAVYNMYSWVHYYRLWHRKWKHIKLKHNCWTHTGT